MNGAVKAAYPVSGALLYLFHGSQMKEGREGRALWGEEKDLTQASFCSGFRNLSQGNFTLESP